MHRRHTHGSKNVDLSPVSIHTPSTPHSHFLFQFFSPISGSFGDSVLHPLSFVGNCLSAMIAYSTFSSLGSL